MPAYGDRLTKRQIDDLVAFVLAAAGEPAPEDRSRAGLARAEALDALDATAMAGVTREGTPARSKGTSLHGWDDWPELVRDEAEFREWVERESAPGWNRTRSRGFPRPGGAPDAGVPGSPGAG